MKHCSHMGEKNAPHFLIYNHRCSNTRSFLRYWHTLRCNHTAQPPHIHLYLKIQRKKIHALHNRFSFFNKSPQDPSLKQTHPSLKGSTHLLLALLGNKRPYHAWHPSIWKKTQNSVISWTLSWFLSDFTWQIVSDAFPARAIPQKSHCSKYLSNKFTHATRNRITSHIKQKHDISERKISIIFSYLYICSFLGRSLPECDFAATIYNNRVKKKWKLELIYSCKSLRVEEVHHTADSALIWLQEVSSMRIRKTFAIENRVLRSCWPRFLRCLPVQLVPSLGINILLLLEARNPSRQTQ